MMYYANGSSTLRRKEGKGAEGFSRISFDEHDLHSLGQYLQEGKDTFFETMIYTQAAEDMAAEMPLSMNAYNEIVCKSALNAHAGRGTPIIRFEVKSVSEASFGYMTYFFEKACAVSGLLLGIFPFDQPGVEIYKAEMRRFINTKV